MITETRKELCAAARYGLKPCGMNWFKILCIVVIMTQVMSPSPFQSRIRGFTGDYSLSNRGSHRSSLFQKPKAQYLPNDVTIINTVDNTLKTESSGSIFSRDRPFNISNGTMQVSSELVPSPEQFSSITYCSDGDAYSDSGFVDGRPIFHDSSVGLASETPTQNYVQQAQFVEDKLNWRKDGSSSDVRSTRFSSFVGGNSEVSSSDLHKLQKNSRGMPEALNIWPIADMNFPRTSPEGVLRSQLKMAGTGQSDFLNKIEDSEGPHLYLEQYPCLEPTFSSDILSIVFGLIDASKFVNLNEKTLKEDLLSYTNYKRLHVDGSQVSFVQYMHSTVCKERTCNCDRFLLVSHFENCNLSECDTCEPVRRLLGNGKPPLKAKFQENSHVTVSCDRKLPNTKYIPAEDGSPPGKRLKTVSSVPFGIGASHEVSPSVNQDCVPEQWLQQPPETPLFHILNTSNYGTRVPSTFQISSVNVSTGNDVEGTAEDLITNPRNGDLLRKYYGGGGEKVIGSTELSDSFCMSHSSGELHADQKDVEREVGGGAVKKVSVSTRLPDSCHAALPAGELIVYQQEYEGEGRVKSDQEKVDVESNLASVEADPGIKAPKPKIMGVSLIDFFNAKEVKEHLSSLCPSVGQETEEKLAGSVGESTCHLCFMDKLSFAVAPVYCSCCGALIRPRLSYHSAIDEMGTRHSFCTACFKVSRGNDISFHGLCISKQKLQKQMNNHIEDESWVQCDKCKDWQHQVCALYNDKRDLGGKTEYVCPRCYLTGMDVGDYTPLPRTGAFEAKDLPTTILSDHIEQRLFRRVKEEREERAKALQMKYEEVPGAADLVVRVVLSVSKLLIVKQQFLDIIPNEKYPTEFPFKSKVVLCFQKIEGVDVCLFGFYVQEFGSECGHPNQRSVYISYLDSVKYFRPEVKTASGEALRTMIYHEILIGYLDYCKKRGFTTCYIWACPPMKGDDYILYCHPVTQKKPKSDKLRKWYKSMLRKAAEEEIAVDCTNLYDHFFVSTGGRNSKITLARLPYFDGDYWSVAAVDIIGKATHGSGVDTQMKAKNILNKRTLKSMGHSNIPGDVAKDIFVMQKLGQTISPLKEDFIMVCLQFTCTACHEVILSGSHWFCGQCKNVHLCSRCHGNVGNTHSFSSGERHTLSQAVVNGLPADTDDRDVILDNGYLEYRHSFLGFCQGNHFQFDTLRRAKHSSMMILYHLHNSTVKSVETTCHICDQKMLVKQGWHCESCPEFNVCDGCYCKQGGLCHVHQLSRHSLPVNHGTRNGKAPPHELLRLRGVMEGLLMHASQCIETKSNACPYPKCPQIKKLWRHAHQCNLRVSGGCQLCKKTWTLLRVHSENCRNSGCRVPRCMDMKKHAEMIALQSDARRSAAVLGSLRAV